MKSFDRFTKPSEIADYFAAIDRQYGNLMSFCRLNNLSIALYHRLYRASACKVTPSTIAALNESLPYYHPDVMINEEIKGLSLEIFKLIKLKYKSVFHFCEANDMMKDYQKIVGFTSGRRKKLSRELILKIRKLTSK